MSCLLTADEGTWGIKLHWYMKMSKVCLPRCSCTADSACWCCHCYNVWSSNEVKGLGPMKVTWL